MRYLSLFSGIGGFDLAFQRAGMNCVGMVEIDKNCQGVLHKQFDYTHVYDDVKEINGSTFERGTVELVCGGFPCQDLSIAGKRAGLAGERSGLWFEFARVIDELEPRWVVIENVPGLLSSDKGKDFAIIIQWLAERGYGVAWRVLDAQYFRVPQRRRRVFIVGSLRNGSCAEVLFEREGMSGNPAEGREEGKATAFDARNGVETGDIGITLQSDTKSLNAQPLIAQTLAGGSNKCHSDITSGQQDGNLVYSLTLANTNRNGPYHAEGVAQTIDTWGAQAVSACAPICMSSGQANAEIVKDGEPSLTGLHKQPIVIGFDKAQITSPDNYSNPKPGDPQPPLNPSGQGMVSTVLEMQHASEAYRPSQGGVAPTLQQRMGTGGNNIPLVGVRRLTPTECERLQGFPDGWTQYAMAMAKNGMFYEEKEVEQKDSVRYRQLGNAVAVPVVEWIGKRIMEAENERS